MTLRSSVRIALVQYPDGTVIGVQNPEEARLVCRVQGVDPNECIRIIDFYPSQLSGLRREEVGQAYVTAAERLEPLQQVGSNLEGHACKPTKHFPAVGIALGTAEVGDDVLVQFTIRAWEPLSPPT